jgi:hypothetical protein
MAAYVPPHKRLGVAALPSDPPVTGAILILHDISNNTILIGDEGKDLFDNSNKSSDYYRYHKILTQPLYETVQTGTQTRKFTREELTSHILPIIMGHIHTHPPPKAYTLGTSLLFPIVELSKDQPSPAIPNSAYYFSRPRIQEGLKEGCPKGGTKEGESATDCIRREVFEEIGDIFATVPITEKEWIRDTSGKRYVTDIIHLGKPEPYAIFYKQVNPSQVADILVAIVNRRSNHMGEVFDFTFKRTPAQPAQGQTDGLNKQTRNAIVKVNAYLASLGQRKLGGGKQTTRRNPSKRRRTSKRREER